MTKRKVPNIVRGGIAIPLKGKTNYYYMAGRKHKNGGIDIGDNPRTGIEVEDGEVMHITDNATTVYSAQKFLGGKSPAERVIDGENPERVFNAQEAYKDKNKINDDGTKKKRMGGLNRSKDYGSDKKPYPKVKSKDFAGKGRSYPIPTKSDAVDALRLAGLHGRSDIKAKVYRRYPELRKKSKAGGLYSVTSNGRTKLYQFPSTGGVQKSKTDESAESTKRSKFVTGGNKTTDDLNDSQSIIFETSPFPSIEQPAAIIPYDAGDEGGDEGGDGNVPRAFAKRNRDITDEEELNTAYQKESGTYPNAFQRALDSAKQYINNNPETIGDTIGLVSNLVGAGVSYRLNKKMLDRMKYSSQPIARQAAKLKTRININPQLDKMRESLAAYERNVRNNTASSRVALARQQQARLRAIMQANELYSSKENQETALINQDRLNQQSVRNANIAAYNKWAEGKAAFENAVNAQKAENTVALLDTINAGIQDVISTRSKRSSERQTRLAMMAAYPNVNPRILKNLGIKGITDKDIENWDKAYGKK